MFAPAVYFLFLTTGFTFAIMQTTSAIAMMRPASFGFNRETAKDNYFQNKNLATKNIQEAALAEFDQMVSQLRSVGIQVLLLQDDDATVKPDAIFLNNWFCCMDETLFIFPMHAANRRIEKTQSHIDTLKAFTHIHTVQNWSNHEEAAVFLEGTGSMIIDHVNRIIYACLSQRTNKDLLYRFAKKNKYQVIAFTAKDKNGNAIYHTNVMMCLGPQFAVICLDAIADETEKKKVSESLAQTGHTCIAITQDQVLQFAGNMLALHNSQKEPFLVMSSTAYTALNKSQLEKLERQATILTAHVPHIEQAGGGSVRCMMAELFY